jgi:CRP-like cAMP-binding protein
MGNSVLAGNLKFLSLGDVLQLLGSNSSTGALRITSRYSRDSGLIYVANGNPVDAKAGSSSGLAALNSLFGWVDGEFEFRQEAVNRENVIKKGRMEIILDALSMLDDGQIEKLGPVSFEQVAEESTLPVVRGPLIDYMYVVDEEEVLGGNNIAVEGKHGGWFWVILEGVADVIKETPQGPLTILRMGEGAFIGSIASFQREGKERSATIVAEGKVLLGVLDLQRLSTDFSRMSHQFRRFILSLDARLKQVTGRAIDIKINRISADEFVRGKKQVMKQGDSEEGTFIILDGEADIVRHTDDGDVPLGSLSEGDFFGSVPFLDIGQEPFSASIFGSENLETKSLDIDVLQNEYNSLSPAFKNLVEHVATCISVTSILACDFMKETDEK